MPTIPAQLNRVAVVPKKKPNTERLSSCNPVASIQLRRFFAAAFCLGPPRIAPADAPGELRRSLAAFFCLGPPRIHIAPSPMGASESLLSRQPQQQPRPQWADEITTVSEGPRSAADADPLLRRIQSLTIAPPLLSGQPAVGSETETSLTDILVRKPSSSASAASGNFNPSLLFELFSMYREWQEEMAKKISEKQEEIENKIATADALAVKLLQRFSYSVTSMRSTSRNLAEVHPLQVEVGELKGRLTEVISNCDALCKRIAAEGPESLQSSVQTFTTSRVEAGGSGSLGPKQES